VAVYRIEYMAATVRIEPAAHEVLSRLARSQNLTITETLTRAVEAYRRMVFLEGVAADFASLRRDRAAWAEEAAERERWEGTGMDGLEDEPAHPDALRRRAAKAPKGVRAGARRT
jgi:hypothetical protein